MRYTVLIADDSKLQRVIVKENLKDIYDVAEASGGQECLDLVEHSAGKIDAVLLDIVMPEMDGFEVLEFMNKHEWIDDIPVIMISSEDSENYIRRAYEMGVTDYINRPFDANIVYQRVSNTVKLYAKQRRLMAMVTRV